MQNRKVGGKRLLKKTHKKKDSLRRCLSLLLSLCMVTSLFSGIFAFPAFAQRPGSEEIQAEPQESTQEETRKESRKESREEIKARLLRQIMYEGWDPYGADMSIDEFYALMEMFQEGTLPLEKDPVAVIPSEEPTVEEPAIEGPTAEEPGVEEPAAEEPGIEEPAAEEPGIEEPTAEEPGIEEPTAGDPTTDDPYIVRPDTAQPTPVDPKPAEPAPTEPKPVNPAPADPKPEKPSPAPSAPILDEPGGAEGVNILREMLLFQGLYAEDVTDPDGTVHKKSTPGKDAAGTDHRSPLKYDNEHGHIKDGANDAFITEEDDYKAGLDPYGVGYTRPPESWRGVAADPNNEMRATVIVPDINAGNPSIASHVDQSLFLEYEGCYVYRVSAQDNDVTVLGVIQTEDSTTYYYTNHAQQETTVSATTLPEGEKFIVEYEPLEYTITYKVMMAGAENDDTGASGDAVTVDDITRYIDDYLKDDPGDLTKTWPAGANITDMTAKYSELVYGTVPTESELGAYAFTAQAPDGYTLSFYMVRGKPDNSGRTLWQPSELKLGTAVETEKKGLQREHTGKFTPENIELTWQEVEGLYTAVNNGWALGEEPVYDTKADGFKIISKSYKSPEYLTLNGTFYNNALDANRLIVGVLRKKPTPEFNATTILLQSDGASKRGTTAKYKIDALNTETGKNETVIYDYEDVYLWARGLNNERTAENKKYEYYGDSKSLGGASRGNIEAGNLATADSWNWIGSQTIAENKAAMDRQPDGTYSFQWTFQTNDGDGGYRLDALEVNRVPITIPFYAKRMHPGTNNKWGEYRERNEDDTGLYAWSTSATLADGAVVTAEMLMLFGSVPQRVYRITVTGAKNNVTITALNLMMGVGAPEFSTYYLDGITGATSRNDNLRMAAVQYYNKTNGWGSEDPDYDTALNKSRGNVIVDHIENGYNPGIQYGDGSGLSGGDEAVGGANFRFKLADGYGNPYFLYESSHEGVINGALSKNDRQASVERLDNGAVDRSTRNDVVPYISNGDDPYMAYAIIRGGETTFVHPPTSGSSSDEKDAFVDAVPVPVALIGGEGGERKPLYSKDGTLYTDWGMIQISTDGNGNETLYPALYYKNGSGSLVPATINDVIAGWNKPCFSTEDARLLKSNYIYRGSANYHRNGANTSPDREDDSYWYYIRVTGQGKWEGEKYDGQESHYRFALLTIVAYPMRYMIRYKPMPLPDYGSQQAGTFFPGGRPPENMPTWDHNHDGRPDSAEFNDADCPAFPPGHEHNPDKPHKEFDDDDGNFYNVETNFDVAISPQKPTDPNGLLSFVGWRLVDENDQPVKIHVFDENGRWKTENGEYVYTDAVFRSGSFDIRNYAEFAIENENMGGSNTDIYVLRLIPVWAEVESPYGYMVALNLVNATGEVKTTYIQNWSDVVTSFDPGEHDNELVVKVLTESIPFQNWLAENGTYDFWNPVNNATGTDEDDIIEEALAEYYQGKVARYIGQDLDVIKNDPDFQSQLQTLLKKSGRGSQDGSDEFSRLGNYTFTVKKEGGTIVIWMVQVNGALEFTKQVQAEPFIHDDEYYFTVEQLPPETDGGGEFEGITGVYRAYPAIYGSDGNKLPVLAKDGWMVRFENGKIVNIKQNDATVAWPVNPVTYFTRQGGDGIILYVPDGNYAVCETGSKSGGSYKAELEYIDNTDDKNGAGQDWTFSQAGSGESLWLKGSATGYYETAPAGVSQIRAEGPVQIGVEVRTICFYNQTSTVAFEKTVSGPYNRGDRFGFTVELKLSDDTEPLTDAGGEYYYFNFNLYDVEYLDGAVPGEMPDNPALDWRPEGTLIPVSSGRMVVEQTGTEPGVTVWTSQRALVERQVWSGDRYVSEWQPMYTGSPNGVWLEAGQRLYVVCTVPQGDGINYEIRESSSGGYHLTLSSGDSGEVRAAGLAYARFVNTMLMILPTTGGTADRTLLVSGAVFVLSGLSLAWLNRDLWRKRRRRFES